jgi:hypothetical protein
VATMERWAGHLKEERGPATSGTTDLPVVRERVVLLFVFTR